MVFIWLLCVMGLLFVMFYLIMKIVRARPLLFRGIPLLGRENAGEIAHQGRSALDEGREQRRRHPALGLAQGGENLVGERFARDGQLGLEYGGVHGKPLSVLIVCSCHHGTKQRGLPAFFGTEKARGYWRFQNGGIICPPVFPAFPPPGGPPRRPPENRRRKKSLLRLPRPSNLFSPVSMRVSALLGRRKSQKRGISLRENRVDAWGRHGKIETLANDWRRVCAAERIGP